MLYYAMKYTIGAFVCLCMLLVCSCRQQLDGSKAAYLDAKLQALTDSASTRKALTPAELSFLDSIHPAASGVGINQLAHKQIIIATASQQPEDKISHADSAINLLEDRFTGVEKTALLFSRAVNIRASIYFRFRNYDEALRNYALVKIALSNVKDSCQQVTYYENMARILYAQRKYLDAAPYFRKVATLTDECRPPLAFAIIQEHLNNTALCFDAIDMADSAFFYYNAALEFIEKNQEGYDLTPDRKARLPVMKAVIYGNQGELNYRLQRYDTAVAQLKKSNEVMRTEDPYFTAGNLLGLMRVYLNTRQLQKAGEVLAELNATVDTTAVNDFYRGVVQTRAEYYHAVGDASTAYRDMAFAHKLRDSIAKRDREFVTIDVAREFENREQKSINDALRKDNKLKQSYLLIFIISTVLAITIAGLVWYNLKRKSLYVARLKKLNSEVEAANEDLHQTLHSLEESHAENTRLLRTVAHDLRNPVGAIRTLAYSLNRKDLPADAKEALHLIQTTCTDSLNLIRDLLDYKKDSAGISKELIDMGRLIEQCSEILQLKAEEKKQQLRLDIDHPKIPANREKLYRVISNLVNNAIKFSPEHSEIIISLQQKESSVLVSVKDNGIGIPEDLKDKIFNLSGESSRVGTAGEESYGLGLSICQKIVREHDGSLWFESEVGKGSVFFMELPGRVSGEVASHTPPLS